MVEEKETITIRKDSLWKYSTFVLVALVVVLGFIVFSGDKGAPTGNVVNTGGNTGAAAVDLSLFLENPSLYPSLGPEDAKTTIIEFSDFQCPYCALASGLPEWTATYSTQYADLIGVTKKVQDLASNGEVRFVYAPMSFLGQESVYSAQAGLCANNQGKFWEMHDAIFTAHDSKENNGKYSKENLKKLAQTISGLDKNEFNNCLDKDETLSAVQQAASEASTAATGTPTFYVNGKKVSASWQTISSIIG